MKKLGTAKICITPQSPVRLCGFGFRTGVYDSVRKDIYARVFDLRENENRILLIYGDLLWWNTEFVVHMKEVISNKMNISDEQILFTASHNHSGPGTGSNFIPLLETVDSEYVCFLEKQLLQGIEKAEDNIEEVKIKYAETDCELNVFRRVKTPDGIQMMPNYQVEADRKMTVFNFYRKDDSLKGRIIHYACHANLSKDNDLHPDYPGYALEMLEETEPDSVSIFWQGFTADMRPNCVLGNQFTAATKEGVKTFAESFYKSILNAEEREEITEEGITVSRRIVKLPVKQELSYIHVTNALTDPREEVRQWAEKVLSKNYRNYEELKICLLRIGEWNCFFFNAEVSMYYAKFARTLSPNTICVGYSDGMIGYISTEEQIKEGGYEPCDSATYFAVAGTYDEAIEEIIHNVMKEMIL